MRKALALVLVLYSAPAMAQGSPPLVGGKPLVQVKPRGAPAKPLSIAAKLQACLDIDDATKERLNCYDAIFPPKPNPQAAAVESRRVLLRLLYGWLKGNSHAKGRGREQRRRHHTDHDQPPGTPQRDLCRDGADVAKSVSGFRALQHAEGRGAHRSRERSVFRRR